MRVLTFLLLINCYLSSFDGCDSSKQNSDVTPYFIDTVKLSRSMKGWELYCWPGENNWNYSILIGTNRNKTYDEVVKDALKGIESLKKFLARIPSQEEIFWMRMPGNSGSSTVVLPDKEQLDQIKAFCEEKQLKLHLAE